jgi:hypothetical protein
MIELEIDPPDCLLRYLPCFTSTSLLEFTAVFEARWTRRRATAPSSALFASRMFYSATLD